jgi:predicted permease
MGTLRQTWNRVRAFFSRETLDRELEAEMQAHLDLAVEENVRAGMTPEEARRRALVRFGGVQQAREQQRETRGLPLLDILGQDIRYTLRTLRRDRAFAIVAVLILGLGIGANVAVFSVVNTILLRPLPFADSQRLVWVQGPAKECGLSCVTYSVDAFEAYQQRNHSLSGVTAYMPFYGPADYKLTGQGEPVPVSGVPVLGNFFQVLGVQPLLGRLFAPEELRLHGRPAVLLSYYFWKRQFGGDRSLVGKAITLNGTPTVVAGVMPESFDFGAIFAPGTKMDVYVPAIPDEMRDWGNTLLIVGRMKPGVSTGQVQAEASLLFPDFYFNNKHPQWGKGYTAKVEPLKEHVSGKLRRSLELLWSAVGLILLIVCVNLSNLMLARAAARSKEFAMRSALGARRARIVRQLLTESLILSAGGAALGLGVAFAVTAYLRHAGSIALPLLSAVRVDGAALGWTLLVAIAAAVLFGTAPALRMSGMHIQESLKDSGHGATAGRRHEGLRAVLVVSEIALACVLLVGAGLLLRSFLRVLEINLGFQPDRAAAISVDYNDHTSDGKRSAAKRGVILEEMLRRVKAIPGIDDAGITDMLPLERNRSWGLGAKGVIYRRGEYPDALVQIVTPGYLGAMGIHLREGRDFAWSDRADSQPVVILNESAAKRLWPGMDSLGRTAVIGSGDTKVIGIVDDVRDTAVEGASDGPEAYLPTTQAVPEGAEMVVRTKLPPHVLAGSVMSVLRAMNPGQPATEFRPIRTLVDHAVSPRRFFVLLVAIFAGLGLTLAALGIYGVIAYSVTRQTQEIGIRMALGASRGRVQRGVMGRTLRLVMIGLAAGSLASVAAARAIASLLFATQPTDLVTYAGMVMVLLCVALVAGYLPARRASRINPMIALRTN